MKAGQTLSDQSGGPVSVTGELSKPLVFLSPSQLLVERSHPDPFNPPTIRYGLSEPARVFVTISTVLGKELVCLLDDDQPGGMHQIQWDGQAGGGAIPGSGIYHCRIVATGSSGRSQVATIRMLLIK